jgi:hypothetical protein
MKSLAILIIIFSPSAYGQNPREIIRHYLDTVSNGNVENWNSIRSFYTESEVYHSQNDFAGKVNLIQPDQSNFHKSFRVLPHHHKIEIYADSSFTKLVSEFYFLKNKTVILLNNVPPVTKQPPARDEFFSAHLPVQISKLAGKSKSIELTGIKEFLADGVSCYEIKMITKGRTYVLYINTSTYLLEYWNGREDGDLSILTKFYNYKKVENFLIPMSESLIKNGVVYFWNHTKNYQINADINMEVFNYKGK